MKLIYHIAILLFLATQLNANNIAIKSNGKLYISDNNSWDSNTFRSIGFSLSKDNDVYISEGVKANNQSNYDVDIRNEGILVMYFEIRNNNIYNSILLSSSFPVVINQQKYRIGDLIKKLVSNLGAYELLYSEDGDTIFKFNKYSKLSFYTDCVNFSYEYHMGKSKKEIDSLKKEGLSTCKVNKIYFLGESKRQWK